MNNKQKNFCDNVVLGQNYSEAYRNAGYKATNAGIEASRLIKNDYIINYIEAKKVEIAAKNEVKSEELIILYRSIIASTDALDSDKISAGNALAKLCGLNKEANQFAEVKEVITPEQRERANRIYQIRLQQIEKEGA
jgi:phage terminase small subunit